jgi:repressor LexA
VPPVLTPRRLELLSALHRLQRQGPVTVADLAAALKLSRTAIQLHLTALRTLGLISEATGKHGGMDLTDEGRLALRLGIPIYGRIAAGPPSLAEQQPDQVTPNMDTFLDVREGDFLLCVSGESMTGIGVMNGDHVLVRPTQEVHDGEVAVVLIPGENAATLKRIYRFGPEVTLISENPAYARMTYPADQVQVQGRMIARVGLAAPRRRE